MCGDLVRAHLRMDVSRHVIQLEAAPSEVLPRAPPSEVHGSCPDDRCPVVCQVFYPTGM